MITTRVLAALTGICLLASRVHAQANDPAAAASVVKLATGSVFADSEKKENHDGSYKR
jgi:hypothetical protein